MLMQIGTLSIVLWLAFLFGGALFFAVRDELRQRRRRRRAVREVTNLFREHKGMPR